jgi:hypothetical protein
MAGTAARPPPTVGHALNRSRTLLVWASAVFAMDRRRLPRPDPTGALDLPGQHASCSRQAEDQSDEGQRFPSREFSAALAGAQGCVTSDHPSALILTDSIGRNIARGCPLVIDLGGYSHDLGRTEGSSRRGNESFQEFALRYLRSGDRAILARFTGEDGWSKATLREIESWLLLAESGRQSVRVPG